MKAQECTATKCNECGEMKAATEYDQNRKTRKCKQCEAKASRLRYLRNREKVLERGARRRVEKADAIRVAMADWYKRNREHVLARCKKYNSRPEVQVRERLRQKFRFAAHKEVILASRAAYYMAHPAAKAKAIQWLRQHYRDNKPAYAAKVRKRQAIKLSAVPAWADQKAITKVYRLAAEMSAATGIKHHVDHIVPLQGRTVCGLHVEGNLQVIPATANWEKGFKLVEDIVRSSE